MIVIISSYPISTRKFFTQNNNKISSYFKLDLVVECHHMWHRHIISRFQCILIDFGEASVEIGEIWQLFWAFRDVDTCMKELSLSYTKVMWFSCGGIQWKIEFKIWAYYNFVVLCEEFAGRNGLWANYNNHEKKFFEPSWTPIRWVWRGIRFLS